MSPVFVDLDPTMSSVILPRPPKWHSLHDSPDLAAVRPLRAVDVRPGDRWVGRLDSARFHDWRAPEGRLRGYWGYEFTAAPTEVEGGRLRLCVWEGDPYEVAPDAWMLIVPGPRPACSTGKGSARNSSGSPRPAWRDMTEADFDQAAPAVPLALVDSRAIVRPVPAVPDRYGTEALFGDAPRGGRAARRRAPAATRAPQPDGLFDLS